MQEQRARETAKRLLLQTWWVVQSLAAGYAIFVAGAGAGLGGAPPAAIPEGVPAGFDSFSPAHAPEWWPYLLIVPLAFALTVLPAYDRVFRGAGQLTGAGFLLVILWFWSAVNVEGWSPEGSPCGGESCTPLAVEQLLHVSPVLAGIVAMIVVALRAGTLHWVVRMVVPPVVFFTATGIQVLIWDPVIVPWLVGQRA
ncbi:hypothetical protein [Zhihengliuella salsuginis]|uniref:Uncharacterized protein n=1 Tax=Zhihengliuella salsuginis TaxID=578222 RepID=A0ABQ3GKE0_9MICC|nr:hypothetical protein [Zhihengliuella salsuginis]GHD12395.1 hypothetical protein GCM10008096_27720 [Zhihengliuella salsuginis]